jgi:hypothetical protein
MKRIIRKWSEYNAGLKLRGSGNVLEVLFFGIKSAKAERQTL